MEIRRREYEVKYLYVNRLFITKIIIDPHVDKHSDHINDELILEIIREINYQESKPTETKGQFKYFCSFIKRNDKWYKIIWLLEENERYIGIVTIHRDRRI